MARPRKIFSRNSPARCNQNRVSFLSVTLERTFNNSGSVRMLGRAPRRTSRQLRTALSELPITTSVPSTAPTILRSPPAVRAFDVIRVSRPFTARRSPVCEVRQMLYCFDRSRLCAPLRSVSLGNECYLGSHFQSVVLLGSVHADHYSATCARAKSTAGNGAIPARAAVVIIRFRETGLL